MPADQSSAKSWTTSNNRNTRLVGYWTASWVLATALVAFGPNFLWNFNTLLTIVSVGIQVSLGMGMVIALRHQVRGLDEMQQRIQLEAAASTLTVGLVIAGSYSLLADIRLIAFEPEIAHLMIMMALTYLIALILGNRRYR